MCRWELNRKLFLGSLVMRKDLAKVDAILALSFITSPSCPAEVQEAVLSGTIWQALK